MPFDGAGQPPGLRFCLGASVAGVEDQGLGVLGEVDGGVHVGFDVVIERVPAVSGGQRDQRGEP